MSPFGSVARPLAGLDSQRPGCKSPQVSDNKLTHALTHNRLAKLGSPLRPARRPRDRTGSNSHLIIWAARHFPYNPITAVPVT